VLGRLPRGGYLVNVGRGALLDNLDRFRRGEALRNAVDRSRGY
jgi:hypothetical protein